MGRKLELLWLRVREYFKHPAEDIRQANPIVPKRLYYCFGNIVKAVPLSEAEKEFIKLSGESGGALPVELLRDLKFNKNKVGQLLQLQQMPNMPQSGLPARCNFCDFYLNGLPCPLFNILKNGETVCDTHKYIILKKQ